MTYTITLVWFMVSLCVFVQTKANFELIANTSYGVVEGKIMVSRSGKEFTAFLGIPFASPPIGSLRFMPPVPPQSWQGVRNATAEAKACVQRNVPGSEDCLYLNVFTHDIPSEANNLQLSSVMVYIHGGGFYGGSSTLNVYGPEYLMDRKIVLVTVQYRLGVFGFLSTEDRVVPGNMGLKDQVRALQWVKDNIHYFGGDPTSVTIFGNSAGAVSVHLHMLSPRSRDLFARAISQSGTASSAFATVARGTSRNITHRLAAQLHCSVLTSEEILNCLQSLNASLIQNEYSKLQDDNYDIRKVLFRPVVEEETEHAFITSKPSNLTSDKPWIVGVNANEGLFKINMARLNETINLIRTEFSKFGPVAMFFEDTCTRPREVAGLIYDYYFKNVTSQSEMIVKFEQVITDSWFVWPTLQDITRHSGTLFCYFLAHQGEYSITQVRGGPKGFGVSHMDELHYLFTQRELFPTTMNEEDISISKLLVNLWVNFAETNNPTPNLVSSNPQAIEEEGIEWKPSNNNSDPNFLYINTSKLSIGKDIFSERMNFWRHLPIRDKY